MVFKCQEDSFLKEFVGKVISCEKLENALNDDQSMPIFKVILDETILFPEGGGQPCDYGTLNGNRIKNVVRDGSTAVHFVEMSEPFIPGSEIKQVIDWSRRLDHMQQHSGQHLITALFDREYGYDTTSWWMGSESSYIELNAKDVTKDQLENIELLANNLIIEGRKVSVAVTTIEEGVKFQDIRAPRGLPADHVGSVRVVTIDGIESNMCCGTHVTNLAQLQCIKLLHVEKSKKKLLVHFLVGQRVIKKLENCYKREMQMNSVLKGGPNYHLELLQKIQDNFKAVKKSFEKMMKDIAIFEAKKFSLNDPLPKYFCLHRQDGIDSDFINTFLRNVPTEDVFYFLTVGDGTGKGCMVLRGKEEDLEKFGDMFADILNGKGNRKNNLYQAKVNKLNKLSDCDAKLKEYFN